MTTDTQNEDEIDEVANHFKIDFIYSLVITSKSK